MNSIVAQNARKIINNMGLKQCVVAQKAGYSIAQFSNILNGRKVITDEDIIRISNTLGVSPNELFGLADDKRIKSTLRAGGEIL